MTNISQLLSCLLEQARRSEGQTMAEYGILIAVIAIIVIVAATVLGGSISALFNSTASQV
ncbi:MAG: Flp family type IVb pilin [Solirubrobacteraceae bacterium]